MGLNNSSTLAVINRLSLFADGFTNRSTQCGRARCCIILQPDFLGLQGSLLGRDQSSMGIRLNARFGADLEALRARNSALMNPESEWAHIDR